MKGILARIGWTQRYFARHIGLSEDTVSGWCKGRARGPGYDVSMKYLGLVARLLGV